MKIGILTQPLHTNYGGLLQNYALQTVLKRMGHEVLTIDLPFPRPRLWGIPRYFVNVIKQIILGGKANPQTQGSRKNINGKIDITSKIDAFKESRLTLTRRFQSASHLKQIKKYSFDAIIVGSDQVWRPLYSPGLTAFFLDFLKNDSKTLRISYAASFGVDKWEIDPLVTSRCKTLIKKFHSVSVRESSGVQLCYQYLDVIAKQVPDPTMLLEETDYRQLRDKKDHLIKCLFVYFLDADAGKWQIAESIARAKGLTIVSGMPKSFVVNEDLTNISECKYPGVDDWVNGFYSAEFVVTDSFHGTVFSIVFNKPFIVIGNQERGVARLTSLLSRFQLEGQLVSDIADICSDVLNPGIDFCKVNKLLAEERQCGLEFLEQCLNTDQYVHR